MIEEFVCRNLGSTDRTIVRTGEPSSMLPPSGSDGGSADEVIDVLG
jgi:hypothetical protein